MNRFVTLFLLFLVINFFDTFFILRYQKHIYGRIRWEKKRFQLRITIVVLITTTTLFFIPEMVLWGMVMFSTLWVWAFEAEHNKKILFQLVLLSLSVLSFVLAYTVSITLFTDGVSIGICSILASHALFAVMVEIAVHLNKSLSTHLPRRMWILLFSIPATSLVCVPTFPRLVDLNSDMSYAIGKNLLPLLFAIFFINMMVFYLFNKFSELLNSKMETALLQQQISMQEKYYRAIEENHQIIRVLQHDMKNHINVLQTLCADGKMEALDLYLQEIKGTSNHVEKLIVTGNSAIDAILNIKISELKTNDVQVTTNILLPQTIKLSFQQSAILFGNLFDNVLEECEHLPAKKRKVTVQLSYTDNILFIKMTNPMAVSEKLFPLQTDKREPSAHGIGLKSVWQVVDQFNGTIKLSAKEGVFQITIVLYGV